MVSGPSGEMYTYGMEYVATFGPEHYTNPALMHEACTAP